ncbi:MAG: site-specific recombinase XerD, partial [Chloroflexi bacterium]|nr:site-specific recombinase XerD [Chloroflexota bacterium]
MRPRKGSTSSPPHRDGSVQLSLFNEPVDVQDVSDNISQLPVAEVDLQPAEAEGSPSALAVTGEIVLPSPPAAPRPQATRLKPAIEEYRQYLAAQNRSKHTRDSFSLDLKLLLEQLGDVPLQAIAERDLRSFISWVSVKRHNSATSVRRKVASLKNFFSYLHRERAISSDPALRLIYPEI